MVRSTLSLSFILACANIVFNIKVTFSSGVLYIASGWLLDRSSAMTNGFNRS